MRVLSALVLLLGVVTQSFACPFCSAVSQTFSEEMGTMSVVAIVKLEQAAKLSQLASDDPQAEVPKSRFVITKVIKGAEHVKVGDAVETIYFGEPKKGRPFLAMATDAPNLMWSTPLILTDRAEKYLLQVSELKPGAARLEFFQEHLEDEDEMLARDAYDEFAKAPYKDVIALKEKMHHDQLLEFIQDKDVPSNRRRLYFTMLGVCGKEEDAKLLEKMMRSKDRKEKAGLDALLACYMLLTRERGLSQVDELFLSNKDSEYADTYAAIMAIRFHGSETDVIPRKRLVKSLRFMLDRPELADLVIPDLARWEDWDIMPKLVQLFVDADENSSWVRVPVVNYLRACPLPVAKTHIEELKKVDAESVKRAMTFFPLGPEKSDDPQSDEAQTADEPEAQQPKLIETGSLEDGTAASLTSTSDPPAPIASGGEVELAEATTSTSSRRATLPSTALSVDAPATMNQVEAIQESPPNLWLMLGVTGASGGICFVAMRSLLASGG